MSFKKLKLLTVDDEPFITETISQLFDDGFTVLVASSGKEALEVVKQNPDIAIVLSDQRMPGMKGVELLGAIQKLAPDTLRILLTGYADMDAILDSVNVGEVFRYVKKPWQTRELIQIVAMAAETYLRKAAAQSTPEPHKENFQLTPENAKAMESRHQSEQDFLAKLGSQAPAGKDQEKPTFEKTFTGKSGKPKLLVVDDEPSVLIAMRELLSDEYDVLTCQSADEALTLLKSDAFVTVLMTDQRMPKKTGTELLIESSELVPLVPKILLTAYTDVEDVIRLINEGQIYRYIQKPWDTNKLRAIIAEAVATYQERLDMNVSPRRENPEQAKPVDAAEKSKPQLSLEALKSLNALHQKK